MQKYWKIVVLCDVTLSSLNGMAPSSLSCKYFVCHFYLFIGDSFSSYEQKNVFVFF